MNLRSHRSSGRRPARLRAEGVQRRIEPVAITLDGRGELDHALRTAPIDDCERRDGAVEHVINASAHGRRNNADSTRGKSKNLGQGAVKIVRRLS